jgi:hypothetical protein
MHGSHSLWNRDRVAVPSKYHTDEERRAANRLAQRQRRERQKGEISPQLVVRFDSQATLLPPTVKQEECGDQDAQK